MYSRLCRGQGVGRLAGASVLHGWATERGAVHTMEARESNFHDTMDWGLDKII